METLAIVVALCGITWYLIGINQQVKRVADALEEANRLKRGG